MLIVEDDDLIASFVRRALIRLGHAVTSAATGQEALAFLESGDIDLVLLDLTLPDIDGLEVLRRIRLGGDEVPVVILTSRSDPKDRAIADHWGVDRYLVKPFPLAELTAIVDSVGSS